MENHINYRLYFINYKKRGDHVEYLIRLNCLEDNSVNSEFYDRYSTLKDLHEVLKKEGNSINFPKFPPKKFFNMDEKFLSQRQTALQHYFNSILGSKEFSQLPSLKSWVQNIINKYNIVNTKSHDANKSVQVVPEVQEPVNNQIEVNPNKNNTKQSFIRDKENMQRCREIVDKFSKNFIDLGFDNNPHYENEDCLNKEKVYKNMLTNKKVFEMSNSKFFKISNGNNNNFECLGLAEGKISKYENYMITRLNTISKQISLEIPENYMIEDLVVKIDMTRI